MDHSRWVAWRIRSNGQEDSMSWFNRLLYRSSTDSAPSRTDAADVNRLWEAVEADDLPQVQALLAQGIDPNSRLSEWPILIFALVRDRMVIADYLIMGGADPNSRGGADTALTLAIEKGNARVVGSLIEAGADVGMRGGFGNLTPKEHAIRQSNSEIIGLIDHALGADTVSSAAQLRIAAGVGDVAGVTRLLGSDESFDSRQLGAALQWTARNDHGPDTVEIARALLAAGADVDFHNAEDPRTAVASAAHAKNIELLRFLIEQRADPTIGDSPMYACNLGFLGDAEKQVSDLLKSARPRRFDGNTLVAAAGAGAREIVRQALEAGIDANAEVTQGEGTSTALIVAAGSHDIETVKLLLAHGANPNWTARDGGHTPLRAAVLTQDEGIVRTLIAAGADLNHRNKIGEDAIDLAYWCGARDIAQILIEAKMQAKDA
jgi:ankyrin repeat protein